MKGMILFLALLVAGPQQPKAADKWDPFIGTWEYRQRNPGSDTGFDREGERIEIERAGSVVVARYFGLERMGDEGLYYTATEVKDLTLDSNGQLSFVVPERHLFRERPVNLEQAKAMKGGAGVSRYELKMTGRIVKSRLELVCSAQFSECPEPQLVFRKGVWK